MPAAYPPLRSFRWRVSRKRATGFCKTQAATALQYGPTEGYRPLREHIVAHMARYGIVATVDNVLITSGSQQALDLIAKLFINRGDRILVESPTYLGALQAFDLIGAEYVTVPIDDDGLRTSGTGAGAALRPEVHVHPAQLPEPRRDHAGALAPRTKLVALSEKYGIPIIEDDPYGQLRYEGEHLTPLLVLDRTNLARDNGYYSWATSSISAPSPRCWRRGCGWPGWSRPRRSSPSWCS